MAVLARTAWSVKVSSLNFHDGHTHRSHSAYVTPCIHCSPWAGVTPISIVFRFGLINSCRGEFRGTRDTRLIVFYVLFSSFVKCKFTCQNISQSYAAIPRIVREEIASHVPTTSWIQDHLLWCNFPASWIQPTTTLPP